ncbi:helix-turn-helix domain-containing protein [uncultured Paenibacillus sp.]|uniref:helix-turn-helix domain-containing protein n=1 Tax=uncultured Paenibacillus sp. TaxID=227322 RepID=UPI0028D339F5|nr:helix-turn-helix domain-containing protein [uncultured Paenibacillus sp.]
MRAAKFSSVFRRFLISYIILLLIPNIAGYMSYRTSIDVAQSSSIENSLMLLKQSEEILERRLAEVEGFTKQLAINQDLNRLISEKKQGETYNVYGLWKMARDVADYSQTNDFLQNFYIYFNNYDVVVTPGSVYFRPEHYYELNQYAGVSFEEWKKTIVEATHEQEILPLRSFKLGKRDLSVLTFAQSLPLNSFRNPQATVVVLIDETKIGSLLESVSSQYGGWAFITDSKGNTLTSQGIEESEIRKLAPSPGEIKETSRFDNGTLLITIRSEKTGWLYTAGIPKQALMEKANKIKYMTWTLSAAASLAGLIIGLLLAYRNSAPINRLLNAFKEQNGLDTANMKNEYDFLAGNISNLIVSNKLLQTELNSQIPLLRDAFIKRLLAGEFNSPQELEAVASQIGFGLDGRSGYASIIKISGYGGIDSKEIIEELSVARLIVKQTLNEIDADLHMTDLGSDKITILFSSEHEPGSGWKDAIETKLARLVESIYANYRISVTVAMGGLYRTLSEINRSFDEAAQAMDYAVYLDEKGTVWFQDTMRETTVYYYPIDTEHRLLNTVKAGEIDEGKRIVAQIFDRNFTERELSREMTEQLIGEMKGTLLKLLDQKAFQDAEFSEAVQNQIVHIQPADGIEQVRRSLESILEQFCGWIAKKKSDLHHETVHEITSFIERSYGDPDLTLYRIAETVGRPEKYISQLFREQTGENLSDYLERTRIGKASDLLIENRLTIDEIAFQVGYNSAHSFRRAFKRVRGVSPSMYRQSVDE